MKVTAGDKTFEINPDDFETVTKYKELSAITKAFGADVDKLAQMDMAGAFVWTLVKRQDPTVRIDDIDFDITDMPGDVGKDESPQDSNGSDAST